MCAFLGFGVFQQIFQLCMETAGIHLLSQQLPVVRGGCPVWFFAPANFGINGCLYLGWDFNRRFFLIITTFILMSYEHTVLSLNKPFILFPVPTALCLQQ